MKRLHFFLGACIIKHAEQNLQDFSSSSIHIDRLLMLLCSFSLLLGVTYPCPYCPKEFKEKHYRTIHMQSHDYNTIYTCNTCLKKFPRSDLLSKHTRLVHSNKEPMHKCGKCDKAFLTQGRLKKHQIVHSEDYSFICVTCGDAFKCKLSLRGHMERHLDVHDRSGLCHICGVMTCRRWIKKHLAKWHDED